MLTSDGTYYPEGLSRDCIDVLERARASGQNIRIFVGDRKTGIAWPEEFEVFGRVARTMGPKIKAAMIVAPREHGGGPFGDSIVAVATAPGRFAWKHSGFTVGDWTIHAGTEGYAADVHHNGELQSRHRSPAQAARYVAFMKGERFAK